MAVANEVAVTAAIDRVWEQLGPVSVVVNSAGICVPCPVAALDGAAWQQTIGINLSGTYFVSRHAGLRMLQGGGGSIVNTASVAGLFGSPGMAAYVASKHGVLGLTKVASTDVAGLGVRVNAVCPGPVETRMMRSLEAQRNPNDPEGVHAAYAAGIPTGRYALPEEIAGAVLYLCSDLSGDVTGTHIVIDGGRSGSGGVAPVKRI